MPPDIMVGIFVSASTEFTLYLVYPKNACTEIKSRSRNADAEAEKAEAGSPLKCKTQRLAATVEAAGTVSGDQPLVEAKENSKYKTQRLAATGNILPVFTLRLAKEISREYLKATVSSNVDLIYNKAVNYVDLIEHLNVLTVEAAGTVSGDQPLADVARETPHKENSKYDTPKLTDTGYFPLCPH